MAMNTQGDRAALRASGEHGVLMYARTPAGEWIHEGHLVRADGTPLRDAGKMAMSGQSILVGMPYEHAGTAYVFERGADGLWHEQQQLAPEPSDFVRDYGRHVAMRDGRAMVSADSGRATSFVEDAQGRWRATQRFSINDSGPQLFVALTHRAAFAVSETERRAYVWDARSAAGVCGADRACVCIPGAGGVNCAERPTCGDGRIQAAEACDDGNQIAGDGCGATCDVECGNGRIDGAEACDDANRLRGDGCDAVCRLERCGNGTIDPGEACDDGNAVAIDGCDACAVRTASACLEACSAAGTVGPSAAPVKLFEVERSSLGISVALGGRFALTGTSSTGPALFERVDSAWQLRALLVPDIAVPLSLRTTARVALTEDFAFFTTSDSRRTVYVFERGPQGEWRHVQTLSGPANSGYGTSLAADGQTLIVGGPDFDNRRGAAWLYARQPDGRWTEQARIDGILPGGETGTQVAIKGATAIIGSLDHVGGRSDSGRVLVVEQALDGAWARTQILAAPVVVSNARFGSSLSVHSKYLAIGAYGSRRAHVFEKNAASQWVHHQQFQTSGFIPVTGVALVADQLFVGLQNGNEVLSYHRGLDGVWVERVAIEPPSADDRGFGSALASDGFRVLVGSRYARFNGSSPGAMFLYDMRLPTCGDDGACVCLDGADGAVCDGRPACGDGIRQAAEACDDGDADALDGCDARCALEPGWRCEAAECDPVCGDGLTIGAEACDDGNADDLDGCRDCQVVNPAACGAVCRPGSLQTLEFQTFAPPGANDQMGSSVALHAGMLLLAARPPQAEPDRDVAAVFERDANADFVETQRIDPVLADDSSGLGAAIAVDDHHLLLGAPDDDDSSVAVYAFARVDDQWVFEQRLFAPDARVNKRFGEAIALHGEWALVGSPSAHGSAAYLYRREAGEWRLAGQHATVVYEAFGRAVGLDGQQAFVAEPGLGRIHIFDLPDLRPAGVIEQPGESNFGAAFAVSDGTLLAATRLSDRDGPVAVLAFTRDEAGQWQLDQQIQPGAVAGAEFGTRIALDDRKAIVLGLNPPQLYRLSQDAQRQWSIGQRIPLERPFGLQVGFVDGIAAVGQPRGAQDDEAALLFTPHAVCTADGACACADGAAGAVREERPLCGDGLRQPAEQCDDGNQQAADECDALCVIE
ncbi:MAG: cysteine-rich repeat protein [Bradymonadia bacterium]|jgi:cysteine-rich repeat protein